MESVLTYCSKYTATVTAVIALLNHVTFINRENSPKALR